MKNLRTPALLLPAILALVLLGLPPRAGAQDSDAETERALQRATDAAEKMGLPQPDVKGVLEENARDEARQKAAAQKVVDAPGPAAFPAWTPKVPQFTAAGPAAKKLVDDEPKVVQTGTSPLTPAELADAWETAARTQPLNRTRNNISSNGKLTTIVFLTSRTDPPQEVRLESRRAPGETITQVTILSPLAVPEMAGDDE